MEHFALSSSKAVSEAAASASGNPIVWIIICVVIVVAVFIFFRSRNKGGTVFASGGSNPKTAKFTREDRQLLDLLCDIVQTYEDSQKN